MSVDVTNVLRGGETLGTRVSVGTRIDVLKLPASVWLGTIIAISTAVRFGLAIRLPGPGIVPDEIVYSELSRSFAATGRFLLRDESFPVWTYGPLYPILIAPAFLLKSLPTAYVAAKAINSLIMSLAAVPAYWLARRLLDRRLALVAAALTAALPAMEYSSRVMTESAFLPVFLLALLCVVRCLERPTSRNQLVLVGVVALATLTRLQGIMLAPVFAIAAVLLAWLDVPPGERDGLRRFAAKLRVYRVVWVVSCCAAVAILVLAGVRGGAPVSLGSGHSGIVAHLRLLELPKQLLYHVAEVDIAVGILPFAAFLLLSDASLRRSAARTPQPFVATSVAAVGCLLVMAGLYATQQPYPRILERYDFYVEPLLLISLLAWTHPVGRSRRGAAAVLVAALLPLLLPYGSVVNSHAYGSTPGLVPLVAVRALGGVPAVFAVVGVASAAVIAAFVLGRARPRARGLAIFLVLSSLLVHLANESTSDDVRQTLGRGDRAWIDHTVGSNRNVTALLGAKSKSWLPNRQIWLNEFFNRSVGPVYYLYEPLHQLPEARLRVRRTTVVFPDGKALRARYVLSNGPRVVGRKLAAPRGSGLALYEVDGAVRIARAPAPIADRPTG